MITIRGRLGYTKRIPARTVHFFTANNTIMKNGELVMGAGNARAAKDAMPWIPTIFGRKVNAQPNVRIHTRGCGMGMIGSFQTKEDWQYSSPIHIIKESVARLQVIATNHPKYTFHLPLPGCENGGRTKEEVMPLLEGLPDNVFVYLGEEVEDDITSLLTGAT